MTKLTQTELAVLIGLYMEGARSSKDLWRLLQQRAAPPALNTIRVYLQQLKDKGLVETLVPLSNGALVWQLRAAGVDMVRRKLTM